MNHPQLPFTKTSIVLKNALRFELLHIQLQMKSVLWEEIRICFTACFSLQGIISESGLLLEVGTVATFSLNHSPTLRLECFLEGEQPEVVMACLSCCGATASQAGERVIRDPLFSVHSIQGIASIPHVESGWKKGA